MTSDTKEKEKRTISPAKQRMLERAGVDTGNNDNPEDNHPEKDGVVEPSQMGKEAARPMAEDKPSGLTDEDKMARAEEVGEEVSLPPRETFVEPGSGRKKQPRAIIEEPNESMEADLTQERAIESAVSGQEKSEKERIKKEEQEKKDRENAAKLKELNLAMNKAREDMVSKEKNYSASWEKVKKILGKYAGDNMPSQDIQYYRDRYNEAEAALASFQASVEQKKEPHPMEEAEKSFEAIKESRTLEIKEKPMVDKMDETLESEKVSLAIAREDAGMGHIREDKPEPKPQKIKPKIGGAPLLKPLRWIGRKAVETKDAIKDTAAQETRRKEAAENSRRGLDQEVAANYIRSAQDPKRRAEREREELVRRSLKDSEEKFKQKEEMIKNTTDPEELEKLTKERESAAATTAKLSLQKKEMEFGRVTRSRDIRFSKAEQDTIRRIDQEIAEIDQELGRVSKSLKIENESRMGSRPFGKLEDGDSIKIAEQIKKGQTKEMENKSNRQADYGLKLTLERKKRDLLFQKDVVSIRNLRKHVSGGDINEWNELKDEPADRRVFNKDGSENTDSGLSDVYHHLNMKVFPMEEYGEGRQTREKKITMYLKEPLDWKEAERDAEGKIIQPLTYVFSSEDLKPKEGETADAWILRMVKLSRTVGEDFFPSEKPRKERIKSKEEIEGEYKNQKEKEEQEHQVRGFLSDLSEEDSDELMQMLDSDDDKSKDIEKMLIERELAKRGLTSKYEEFLKGKTEKGKDGKEKMKKPTKAEISTFLKDNGLKVGEHTEKDLKDITKKIKFIDQMGWRELDKNKKINIIENNVPMPVLEDINRNILEKLSQEDRSVLLDKINRDSGPKEISQFVAERLPARDRGNYEIEDKNGKRDSLTKQNLMTFLAAAGKKAEAEIIDMPGANPRSGSIAEGNGNNNGSDNGGGGGSEDESSALDD